MLCGVMHIYFVEKAAGTFSWCQQASKHISRHLFSHFYLFIWQMVRTLDMRLPFCLDEPGNGVPIKPKGLLS